MELNDWVRSYLCGEERKPGLTKSIIAKYYCYQLSIQCNATSRRPINYPFYLEYFILLSFKLMPLQKIPYLILGLNMDLNIF